MSSQAVAVQAPARALPGAGLLSGATLLAGLLTYAFHAVAARRLGPSDYGQIAVLWSALFLGAVVLWRPLEQTLSRTLADRLARGSEGWSAVRSVALVAVGGALAAAVGLAAAWEPVTDRLFLRDGAMTTALLGGLALYGLAYVVRGLVGGARWFGGYALALLGDALARLGVGVVLLLVVSKQLAALAVAVAAVGGVFVPLGVGSRRLAAALRGGSGEPFSPRAAVGFAAPAAVVAAADQVLVNAGPLLVVLGGGVDASAAAGIVFAALMLVRVPVFLFQGFAGSLLPNLTRLQARDDGRFRAAVARTVAFLVAAGLTVAVLAATAGPETMGLLFGPDYSAGRDQLAVLGLGAGCYLAAATLGQALLALDRGSRAATAWAASACAFVALYAALPGGPLDRVAVAFAAAAALALALLVPLLRRELR